LIAPPLKPRQPPPLIPLPRHFIFYRATEKSGHLLLQVASS